MHLPGIRPLGQIHRPHLSLQPLPHGGGGLGWDGMGFAFANGHSAQQRWVIFLYTGYRLIESFSDVWHGYLQRPSAWTSWASALACAAL